MSSRSQLSRWTRPVFLAALAGAAALAMAAVAVGLGVASVRWAHHVAAFFELALLLLAALLLVGWVAHRLAQRVPRRVILEVDLHLPIREEPAAAVAIPGVAEGGGPTLRDLVDTIHRAAGDPRVVALFGRIGRAAGLGQIQELRDAIACFRDSGKPAIAFSETFGEFAPGNGAYYLATAFDRIALQPSGDLNITGLMASVVFARGALDKLGVVPRLDHRRDYKTAMNALTETGFTPAHRESLGRVAESQFGQMVRGIAERRGLSEPDVRDLFDAAPLSAQAAHAAGLVDQLAYRDQILADVEAAAEGTTSRWDLWRYAKRTRSRRSKGDTVALISGVGAIRLGRSGGVNPLDRGRRSMGSDTVAGALRAAVEDKRVKAILLRIDSPGGSYAASDTIWRETVRARDAGKPVVVSMGNVAGSGGYFIAMAADRIVAQPGTITGSIGIFAGKGVTTELRAKLGLTTDELHTSANATMWSDVFDYSADGWQQLQAFLDRTYQDFTGKVASGRGLAHDQVLGLAGGRIWTGEDALRLGLVDELGGYNAALRCLREAMGRPPGSSLHLEPFPQPTGWRKRLPVPPTSALAELSTEWVLGDLASLLGPIARLTSDLNPAEAGVLTMPPFDVTW